MRVACIECAILAETQACCRQAFDGLPGRAICRGRRIPLQACAIFDKLIWGFWTSSVRYGRTICIQGMQIMTQKTGTIVTFDGILGMAAHRQVFFAIAPANVLFQFSFADILNEDTSTGYQRRFNHKHSLDFRNYIQQEQSTTIPLTLNLRQGMQGWLLVPGTPPYARLEIDASAGKVLAQVDCQHRLGYLNDVPISMPFMCFLGLSQREEMEIFSVINGKAKGLNTSLLDYHDAALTQDLAKDRPELFIALHLNTNPDSCWHRQLHLGGTNSSGLLRRASLRTMQKAIRRFLTHSKILDNHGIETATQVVLDFWAAIAVVLQDAWNEPRKYLLTKGIGVYALMDIAGDLFREQQSGQVCDRRYFSAKLSEFITDIDWTTTGPLKGFGGEGGANSALAYVRTLRGKDKLRVVARG
jgi:DNA sulfur modification protein DndB